MRAVRPQEGHDVSRQVVDSLNASVKMINEIKLMFANILIEAGNAWDVFGLEQLESFHNPVQMIAK